MMMETMTAKQPKVTIILPENPPPEDDIRAAIAALPRLSDGREVNGDMVRKLVRIYLIEGRPVRTAAIETGIPSRDVVTLLDAYCRSARRTLKAARG